MSKSKKNYYGGIRVGLVYVYPCINAIYVGNCITVSNEMLAVHL